jgi:hypothetical protein
VSCAYAYAAASHADAWLAEHFQKQNALGLEAAHWNTGCAGPAGFRMRGMREQCSTIAQ